MSQEDIRKQQEEDEAVLAFLGGTYGELKKLDGDLIAPSSTLRPRSEDAKIVIEDFVKSKQPVPRAAAPTSPPSPPPPVEVQQPQVQAQQPVTPVQQVVVQPSIEDDQLSFNFDVSEKDLLFEKIDKLTSRVDKLHNKVDKLYNELFPPVKKQSKKKSVESKEEK